MQMKKILSIGTLLLLVSLPSSAQVIIQGGSGGITANSCAGGNYATAIAADGTLTCSAGSGATSPAGSNTQVQFNNSGSFGASANLTWVSPALTIGVAGTSTGQLKLTGATSGTAIITAPATAGTPTLTLPTTTGTFQLTTGSPAAFVIASQATGDILYASSATAWTRLGVGSNGQVLTLASGVPSWAAAGGGGSPGGSDTYVQYNDGGSTFNGDSALRINKTNHTVGIGQAGDATAKLSSVAGLWWIGGAVGRESTTAGAFEILANANTNTGFACKNSNAGSTAECEFASINDSGQTSATWMGSSGSGSGAYYAANAASWYASGAGGIIINANSGPIFLRSGNVTTDSIYIDTSDVKIGQAGAVLRNKTNCTTPGSLANGDWWTDTAAGDCTTAATTISLKQRHNGVTRTVASVTF